MPGEKAQEVATRVSRTVATDVARTVYEYNQLRLVEEVVRRVYYQVIRSLPW